MAHGPDTEELLRRIATYNSLPMRLLRYLNLRKNILDVSVLRITSLPTLPPGLQNLECKYTHLTSLPDLPVGLQRLYCYGTQITCLPALPVGLQKLLCFNTPITSLPKLPHTLQELICYNTQITSLPELPAGLRYLSCWDTPLRSLPDLPAGLQVLCCSCTRLTTLPELPATLHVLNCSSTPLLFQRNEGESINHYNLRWRKWREGEEELESKQRIQERTKLFKERLMASTWHPDRFERWCLDEEEKKENEEMWG